MLKIIQALICMALIGGTQCVAQSNGPPAVTNWGKSVQGVQLGITMTNNVFRVGSSTVVESVTKNASANSITVNDSVPAASFDVVLTSRTGKLYHVLTLNPIMYPAILKTIQIGEQIGKSIPVTFAANIPAGDYTLKA